MSISKKSIGTRNESSLHRTLKYCYADNGKTEVTAGEFVADGINRDGEYIEVQTSNFASLKKKVKEFSAAKKVRIIHPIAVKKIIEVYAPDGDLLSRRKSPLKGSLWNIFDVLIHAPELLLIRKVTIEVVLADIVEKRINDGKGAWRRKGISIHDKELAAWHECIVFQKPADFLKLIPFKKNEEFTATVLAKHTGIKPNLARKALYVLTKINLVKRTGKNGRAWVYQV